MKIDWNKLENKLKPPKCFWRAFRKVRDKIIAGLISHKIDWDLNDIGDAAWEAFKLELRQYIEVDMWKELPWYYQIVKPFLVDKLYKFAHDAGIDL